MVKPGVEAHAQLVQLREALPEHGVRKQPLRRSPVRYEGWVLVPRGGVSDSPEPVWARGEVRFEDRLHAVPQSKVRVSNNPGVYLRLATLSDVVVRDALHELCFPQRPHLGGAIRLVHGRTFEEDRLDDVVPGAEVDKQVRQEITVAGALPQVVVRVADRQVGVYWVLSSPGEPVFSYGCHIASFLRFRLYSDRGAS